MITQLIFLLAAYCSVTDAHQGRGRTLARRSTQGGQQPTSRSWSPGDFVNPMVQLSPAVSRPAPVSPAVSTLETPNQVLIDPNQRDYDFALNRSILSVLYRIKDTYNGFKHWEHDYFHGSDSSVINRLEKDIALLNSAKKNGEVKTVKTIYGFEGLNNGQMMKKLQESKERLEDAWKTQLVKMKKFLHAFTHFSKYEDDRDYRTKVWKFFKVCKVVSKFIYAVGVAGLGAGVGVVAVGDEVKKATTLYQHVVSASNYTKELDLLCMTMLETKHIAGKSKGTTPMTTAQLKAVICGIEKPGDFMNYRVKMDNPTIFKNNEDPLSAVSEWIETYQGTLNQLQARELSDSERVRQIQNRFNIQNLLCERTIPPEGIMYKNGQFQDHVSKKDGTKSKCHRTYVERIVFVAYPRTDKTNGNAIKNFQKKELAEKENINYIAFNTATEDAGLGEPLVGVIEFKIPQQLEITWRQGVHFWQDCVVSKCLKTLAATHDFTIYHLGYGNVGESAEEAAKEQEWIATRDWQTVPIIKKHIKTEMTVNEDKTQQEDLDIFKRAALAVEEASVEKTDIAMLAHINTIRTQFRPLTVQKTSVFSPGPDNHVQWGAPSEHKTPVFTQTTKLYSVYKHVIEQVHKKNDADFKINHYMRVTRTTSADMLNFVSPEIARTKEIARLSKLSRSQ